MTRLSMPIVILNAGLDLCDGLADNPHRIGPVAAFVARSQLQVPLGFTQVLQGGSHLGLRFTPAAFPAAIPAALSPVAAAPAAELRAVHGAAFAKLKHAILPVRPARIDAEGLVLSFVGIHAKGAVAHAEGSVLASQLLQTVSDVDVMPGSAILRAQDDVLAGVPVVAAIAASAIATSAITAALPVATPATLAPVAPTPAAEL